ncbi:autophagy-related protein 17 [Hysterangium stoloniferum]|nr:autophagy-related protein 17 [Hysterangium stoloniferum]
MASSVGNTSDRPLSPPHLVSLVLQSKKGLQHGEQLCSRAHDITNDSARNVVEVLALDSKIQWITEGIFDQLKVAVGVAKSINERRLRLEEEAKANIYLFYTAQDQEALDNTLESLGSQVVPPSFHQSSLESSLFGIQASDNQENTTDEGGIFENAARKGDTHDLSHARHKWKTLRDFVDERGLEDVFESIEGERNALDEILAATVAHSTAIMSMTDQIRAMLSNPASVSQEPSLKNMAILLRQQEDISTTMANHLESLAAHYDQMATALKEKEGGEELGEEDMEGMSMHYWAILIMILKLLLIVFVRDTAELPAIIADLEESITSIEAIFDEILSTKNDLQSSLATRSRVLDSLDFLGDRMESMLQEQSDIEASILFRSTTYQTLNDYLESLLTLRSTYESYQLSYNALVLEMDRRRLYRDSMEGIVQEMKQKLEKLREDEISMRDAFYLAHSASIPDDLCLAISNLPEPFSISSGTLHNKHGDEQNDIGREVLPEIHDDLLEEVRFELALFSMRILIWVKSGPSQA